MAQSASSSVMSAENPAKRVKLTGRAFYESIGSPKMIVAPMVDRSEFAWRLLTRSYLDPKSSKELLAYSPMLHARLFKEQAKFRDAHFQPVKDSLTSKVKSEAKPFLDGNPAVDRPLFVQFCANKADDFLDAAEYVAPYCDAVDLNLGCPQGIARSGHYGAFLQEDWDIIHSMIRKLKDNLSVPVTAKMRILETKEETLKYAKMILDAGASILTVHGRRREQKGHNTGVADWSMIRYLRDNLPPDTVLFANGNILNYEDLGPCLEATGADGVMSAEGNLSDPTIFARPPEGSDDAIQREYWRNPHNPNIGGYRVDGVFRRYMDIVYRHVLEQEPPQRPPLYLPGDHDHSDGSIAQVALNAPISSSNTTNAHTLENLKSKPTDEEEEDQESHLRPSKKAKHRHEKKAQSAAVHNPNLKSMQGHLFQLLRSMLSDHIPIRDALAKARAGDIQAFENVLLLVEEAVKQGLDAEHASLQNSASVGGTNVDTSLRGSQESVGDVDDNESSARTRAKYRRPFWVCQPHIRPLPSEALKIGAMTLSKKDKEKAAQNALPNKAEKEKSSTLSQAAVTATLSDGAETNRGETISQELPKEEALACG